MSNEISAKLEELPSLPKAELPSLRTVANLCTFLQIMATSC
jgi:hypothetical protein